MTPLAIHIALTLALLESVGLALLLAGVRGLPGVRLLIGFLLGVAVWILSCELTQWLGPAAARPALALVAFSSLSSAVFFHFTLVLCAVPRARALVCSGYAIGGATTLLGLLVPPGAFGPWHGFASVFFPNTIGWIVGIAWALLSLAGHLVLLRAWWRRDGPPRGQLIAMCAASGAGALAMSGYAFPALAIDAYPLPLFLLPLYPLILVFGILRYRLMIVNSWARRALAWGLMMGVGSLLVIALAALLLPFGGPLPGWQLWLVAMVAIVLSALLLDPFRRLANRLVYPGSQVDEQDLQAWRARLNAADSFDALARIATGELSERLRIGVDVVMGDSSESAHGTPTLVCGEHDGAWQTRLLGWEAAPIGPRHVAQLFGNVLADSASRLAQLAAAAEGAREQQKQERLAELGALAATVAHDIRNPLNIIAMAAAGAPADVRNEISTQAKRISQLAADLLDYASSWKIEPRSFDLGDHLRASIGRSANIELGAGLEAGIVVQADARRLTQALTNLLENARAAIADAGPAGRIALDARRDADGCIELSVADNGSGIPAEIRHTLFQPFVSRRADGTGLGLAIVAKIMQAHGGEVRLAERAPWSTCFVLRFPPGESA